jgi:glutamate-1-semialdehyde 2,1-aminomutase
MIDTATHFAVGVQSVIDQHSLPWSLSQLGARAEYRFANPAPRNGTASAASADPELEDLIHLYLLNRGICLTPFHNMALMSPVTTAADVDLHHEVFGEVIGELAGD